MAPALLVLMLLVFLVPAEADIYRYVSEDGVVSFTNAPLDKTKAKVFLKERTVPRATPKSDVAPSRRTANYQALAEEKAVKHDLDPHLVKAVIKAESNWNPNAVSPKGARGLMQLMQSTANDMGVQNIFDPEENIAGGTRYLRYLLDRFNGNLTFALAAYNAGPTAVERSNGVPAIPETVTYVQRVLNHYNGGSYLPASSPGAPKELPMRILKVVLDDGSLLYTNVNSRNTRAVIR